MPGRSRDVPLAELYTLETYRERRERKIRLENEKLNPFAADRQLEDVRRQMLVNRNPRAFAYTSCEKRPRDRSQPYLEKKRSCQIGLPATELRQLLQPPRTQKVKEPQCEEKTIREEWTVFSAASSSKERYREKIRHRPAVVGIRRPKDPPPILSHHIDDDERRDYSRSSSSVVALSSRRSLFVDNFY